MRERTKITVTLKKKELLYDIDNIAYITGDILGDADTTPKYRSDIQSTREPWGKSIIIRALDRAFYHLRAKLTAYTKSDTREDMDVTDDPKDLENYVLTLYVPQEVSESNIDGVACAAHNYLVYSALCDWFEKLKKDERDLYLFKLKEEMDLIKHYLTLRTKPMRLRQSPF
mgnify:CR=1 FL=1